MVVACYCDHDVCVVGYSGALQVGETSARWIWEEVVAGGLVLVGVHAGCRIAAKCDESIVSF